MSEKQPIVDRGALYYPFIHVRDDNWLKATLLCFPYVDRMVPAGYEVNDQEVASAFAGEDGRMGRKMLGRQDLDNPQTQQARSELLGKLMQDSALPGFVGRFTQEAAMQGPFKDGANAFQIHEYKVRGALLEFLKDAKLAWQPSLPVRGGAQWWSVHPVLGEAIMSTNAVALARMLDLEVVTSDGPTHQSLMGTTASDVYDTLIRHQILGQPRTVTQKVNDMMRLVIVSAFDLSSIAPHEIAELSRQRRDIASLKAAILSEIEDVGEMPNREVWEDVLSARAKDVIAEWNERASLWSLFKKIDVDDLSGEAEGLLKQIAPTVLAGTAATAIVGVLPGLFVGVAFGVVNLAKKWKDSKQPYRFFSSLNKAGAKRRHVLEASPA